MKKQTAFIAWMVIFNSEVITLYLAVCQEPMGPTLQKGFPGNTTIYKIQKLWWIPRKKGNENVQENKVDIC